MTTPTPKSGDHRPWEVAGTREHTPEELDALERIPFVLRDPSTPPPTIEDLTNAAPAAAAGGGDTDDVIADLKHHLRNRTEDCDKVREALRPLYPDQPENVRAGWIVAMEAAPELARLREENGELRGLLLEARRKLASSGVANDHMPGGV